MGYPIGVPVWVKNLETINLFNKKINDAKINYINLLFIVEFHFDMKLLNEKLLMILYYHIVPLAMRHHLFLEL